MVLKLQISCNKKALTEIFGKVVGVWKWLLTFIFFLLNNLLIIIKLLHPRNNL